jgi:hypothetical protein
MPRSKHYYIRRTHRYLGIVLGIQFLLWTISGLYFSWTNIDEIHGDFQHKHSSNLLGGVYHFISPDSILKKIQPEEIHFIQLLTILQKPFYGIKYSKEEKAKLILADAVTGIIKSPVGKEEAIQIAAESFNGEPKVTAVKYLINTNAHHEYREKPLPAWAVTFDHPSKTTVYVSAERGMVETFRNNKWRLFDFLWMGHTMGYKDRDDINNWLLRIFSVCGLITVLSGFTLFLVSSKRFKRKQSSAQ